LNGEAAADEEVEEAAGVATAGVVVLMGGVTGGAGLALSRLCSESLSELLLITAAKSRNEPGRGMDGAGEDVVLDGAGVESVADAVGCGVVAGVAAVSVLSDEGALDGDAGAAGVVADAVAGAGSAAARFFCISL